MCQRTESKLDLMSTFLASDRAFRGIGPRRAAALARKFGSSTIDAIRCVDPGVIEIVGEEVALNAAAEVEVRQAEITFLEWLQRINAPISTSRALCLARAWGPQGLADVQVNPYLLLSIAPWVDVEHIARSLGVSEDDPRRDAAAIETALTGRHGLEEGHTGLREERLFAEATRLLRRAPDPLAVDRAVEGGGAVRNGDIFQPPGAAWMEADLATRFLNMSVEAPAFDLITKCSEENFKRALELSLRRLSFSLTDVQRAAVAAAHAHRLLVLAGYAGSGKTTVLRVICDTMEAIGRQPTIVALSGRAAQRATEATGRRALTVAAFLHRRNGSERQMRADEVLIADEASMLSLSDIWRLVRRLGDASLILCGDPAQLPPIGPGMVFHTLSSADFIPRIVLDRVMRQTARSGIPAVAECVRHGKAPDIESNVLCSAGVSFIPCQREDVQVALEQVGRGLRADGLGSDDIQIITPTKAESSLVNEHFHAQRRARGATPWPGPEPKFVVGDPVMWRKNDAARGLVNGSLGRILSIDDKGIMVLFDGSERRLSAEDSHLMELAYAITVHKAQGSQWPVVIAPIFSSRLLDRTLLYTAITRASKKVILLGDQTVFSSSIRNTPISHLRTTGLPRWLHLSRDLRAPARRD